MLVQVSFDEGRLPPMPVEPDDAHDELTAVLQRRLSTHPTSVPPLGPPPPTGVLLKKEENIFFFGNLTSLSSEQKLLELFP